MSSLDEPDRVSDASIHAAAELGAREYSRSNPPNLGRHLTAPVALTPLTWPFGVLPSIHGAPTRCTTAPLRGHLALRLALRQFRALWLETPSIAISYRHHRDSLCPHLPSA